MTKLPLKHALQTASTGAVSIKGAVADEPGEGLFPGYSASGQDVWLEPVSAPFVGPGLILSAVGARCGKVFYANGRWGVVANTTVLLPRPGHDARFLWYLTNNEGFWDRGVTAQPYVRTSETLQRPVHLPSIEEQRRIAEFLDDQAGRLDQALALRRQQADVLLESVNARLTNFYTEAVEHFGAIRLGLLLNGLEQGWSPQCEDRLATATGYGVLKAGAVNGGTFRQSENKALPSDLSPRLEYLVRPGDLLMSRASGSLDLIGSAAVVPSDTPDNLLLCDKIYRLSVDHRTDPVFIALMLRSRPAREAIKLGTSGAEGMANNLPSDTVRGLLIPAAPFDYQRAVAAKIISLDDQVRQAREMLRRSAALLEERKRALITAAVTGQFDVTTARAVA